MIRTQSKWDKDDAIYPDFLLIATKSSEAEDVRAHLKDDHNIETHAINGARPTAEGFYFKVRESYFKCILVSGSDQMGTELNGIMTSGAIFIYRPRVALAVGMCGGIGEDVSIGDVMLIMKAYAYDTGTETEETTRCVTISEECDPIGRDIAERVLKRDHSLKNSKDEPACIRKVEGLLGHKVLERPVAQDELRKYKRIAVYEMEATSFFSAASNCNRWVDPSCSCVALGVYKGVADTLNSDQLQLRDRALTPTWKFG